MVWSSCWNQSQSSNQEEKDEQRCKFSSSWCEWSHIMLLTCVTHQGQPSNWTVIRTSKYKLLRLIVTVYWPLGGILYGISSCSQLQFCPWLSLGIFVSSLSRTWMGLALQRPVKVWGGARSAGQGDPLTYFLPLSLNPSLLHSIFLF